MRDGRTRKISTKDDGPAKADFLEHNHVVLVLAEGAASGSEFPLTDARTRVGRGPDVDLAFDDTAMSREHVAFELVEGGMRARDLASTNGLRVNGADVLVADLKHGDTVEVGSQVFRLLIEPKPSSTPTYVVGAD